MIFINRQNYFLVLILTLFVSGCAILKPTPNEDAVRKMIGKQEYEKALQLTELQAIKEGETAAVIQERNDIKQLIRKFEKKTILTSSKHEEEGNFAIALSLIEDALNKIPSSQRLQEYYVSLKAERDLHITRMEHRLALANAKYNLEKRELIAEKARLKGKKITTWWQKGSVENSLKSLNEVLLECGGQAIERSELKLAGDCLNTAQKIKNNTEVQQMLSKWKSAAKKYRNSRVKNLVKRNNNSHSKEKKNTVTRKTLQQIQQARNDLITALEKPDYNTVQANMQLLRELNGMSQEIEQLLEEKTKKLLSHGNRLYRSGEISEAREVWHHVLLIEPDNTDAIANIERAEHVLKRLEELRKDDGVQDIEK